MPVRYFTHNEIDKSLWDEAVLHSPNGNLYALSWYLDIVSPDWEALIEGNYENIFPLTQKKKYGFSYLAQPPFTQQLGLISRTRATSDRVNHFLKALPRHFRFVEMNLNKDNIASHEEYQYKQNINYELSLLPDYTEIRKRYSTNLLRNLKKAMKNEHRTECGKTSIQDMIQLFRRNRGAGLDQLGNSEYSLLSLLLHEIHRRDKGEVYSTFSKEGEMIAAAFFATFREKRIFLFSATGRQAKETAAMPELIDLYISRHCGQKRILDFEGSNDAKLGRFYRGFGADVFSYQQVRKNNLPAFLRWIKK